MPSFTPRALILRGINPIYPGGPQSQSGRYGVKKNVLPLPGIESQMYSPSLCELSYLGFVQFCINSHSYFNINLCEEDFSIEICIHFFGDRNNVANQVVRLVAWYPEKGDSVYSSGFLWSSSVICLQDEFLSVVLFILYIGL
jgi:hypothetical protein